MKTRIFYTKPSITELEVRYANDAAKNGWGNNCYDYINRFEEIFKKHIGVNYSISTSSCTGALHMGMAALGIGSGDEVIMADTNWIATASAIVNLGAKPIFVDILPDTWCIDPEKIELAITKKTKAIIAVHLYGNLCEMDKIIAIGEKYKIPIIEDAAEAIGSVWHGKRAGAIGNFAVFSFHGTKTVTTGEGGMFVTNDSELFNRVLTLSNHGRVRGQEKQFWPEVIGFKYKLSNIQAAIGFGQMERIDELIDKKRTILKKYKEYLKKYAEITLNPEYKNTINGAWMPTVVFNENSGIKRNIIQNMFNIENIDARVFFWPLSSLPMFEPIHSNIHAWSIPERAINLPSYHDMNEDDIKRVVNVIKKIIKHSKKD
jgi:perosamine synthetase